MWVVCYLFTSFSHNRREKKILCVIVNILFFYYIYTNVKWTNLEKKKKRTFSFLSLSLSLSLSLCQREGSRSFSCSHYFTFSINTFLLSSLSLATNSTFISKLDGKLGWRIRLSTSSRPVFDIFFSLSFSKTEKKGRIVSVHQYRPK